MQFDPKPFTIVKSVAQRGLLKWWNDLHRKGKLPSLADCEGEDLARLKADIALYRVERADERLRFRCLSHGVNLRPIDGQDLTGLYQDAFLPEEVKATALAAYEATVTMGCPIYTLRNAVDAEGVPVTFERLRVPLSQSGREIDHLLTHIEIFCEDGRYQRNDLLRAGVSMGAYVVTAAISFAAISLSPGAQVIDT